jgi:hypothetical protein
MKAHQEARLEEDLRSIEQFDVDKNQLARP